MLNVHTGGSTQDELVLLRYAVIAVEVTGFFVYVSVFLPFASEQDSNDTTLANNVFNA